MNVRFWIFINDSPVKITMKPGQSFTWEKAWGHEEGWSSIFYEWQYFEDTFGVARFTINDGSDCDGRLTSEQEDFCYEENLQSFLPTKPDYHDGQPIFYPKWEEWKPTRIRDQFAEMAGY